MGRNETTEVEIIFITHTDKAISIRQEEGESIWIPKSLVKNLEDSDYKTFFNGDEITIEIPEWLAEEKDLI